MPGPQHSGIKQLQSNESVAGYLLLDPLHRAFDQFREAAQTELLFYVRPMGVDGLDAEMQVSRDLLAAAALPEQFEHFQFPIA